jgi:hypothetical protein
MKIPKAITVGKTRFMVEKVKHLDRPPAYGRIDLFDSTIKIARKSIHGKLYSSEQRAATFWHEVLHACLLDAGKPLRAHDEKLVDALAVRIAQVCRTAEV